MEIESIIHAISMVIPPDSFDQFQENNVFGRYEESESYNGERIISPEMNLDKQLESFNAYHQDTIISEERNAYHQDTIISEERNVYHQDNLTPFEVISTHNNETFPSKENLELMEETPPPDNKLEKNIQEIIFDIPKEIKLGEVLNYDNEEETLIDKYFKIEYIFRRERYLCSLCSHQTNKKSDIKNHIRSKHRIGKRFECKICKGLFSTRSYFIRHMKKIHNYCKEEKLRGKKFIFRCSFCETVLENLEEFRKHNEEFHPEQKNIFTCEICGMRYEKFNSIICHYEKCHKIVIINGRKCFVCGAFFSRTKNNLLHMKFYHNIDLDMEN